MGNEVYKKKTLTINISETMENEIKEIIKNDVFIKNFGHFAEISIHQYLKHYKSRGLAQTILDSLDEPEPRQ